MVAFEIFINGKKKCTAGIGKPGVVTTILNWVQADEQRGRKPSEDMELSVGGLISRSREFLEWFRRDLKRGDEIVYESSSPKERTHRKLGDGRIAPSS